MAETTAGRLTRDRFGFSAPVHAPLYAGPPYFYRGARALIVRYETDYEMALELLPDALDLPERAIATVMAIDYPFSSFGPYHEAIHGIECLWQGHPRTYVPHILVDSEAALAAGREVWGDPKKLAQIDFAGTNETMVATIERPAGVRLCTMMVRAEKLLEPPVREHPTQGSIALRVIPSPEPGAKPSIAELIEVNDETETLELWGGTGSVSFDSASAFDPWHLLPVVKLKGGYVRNYHLKSPGGTVLMQY